MATPTDKPPYTLPEDVRRLAHMLLHMTYVQGMEAALEGIASEGKDLALDLLENHCSTAFVAQAVASESIDLVEPNSHDERVALYLLRGLTMDEQGDVLSRAHISHSKGFRDPEDT